MTSPPFHTPVPDPRSRDVCMHMHVCIGCNYANVRALVITLIQAEDFVGPFTAESMHYVTVGAGSPIDYDHHHSLSASARLRLHAGAGPTRELRLERGA